jgi:hypothetical protein
MSLISGLEQIGVLFFVWGAILITSAKPLPLDGECASSYNALPLLSRSCMEYPTTALFKTLSAEENAAA